MYKQCPQKIECALVCYDGKYITIYFSDTFFTRRTFHFLDYTTYLQAAGPLLNQGFYSFQIPLHLEKSKN